MSNLQEQPLVSVVTAAFNALEGLQRTVESVAAQEGVAVEHIVIDGGSTDGTRDYLESLGDTVKWVSEPDDGIADAMNKGVAMANGEYVLVLQAGDTFVSDESLTNAHVELGQGGDIVAFDVRMILPNGNAVLRRSRRFGWLTEFKMTNPHQGMLCKRDLFARIGGFDISFGIAMDYEWLLRAKRAGASLRAVNRVLSIMPATGVSTQMGWDSIETRLDQDRRLQALHARGPIGCVINVAFWIAYKPFKRFKAGLSSQ